MKPVLAWAIVDEKGNIVVEFPAWGTAYLIGSTRIPLLNTGERVVRVEIREVTRPKKAKR